MRFSLFTLPFAVAVSGLRVDTPTFEELPKICEFSAVDAEVEAMTDAELQASIATDLDAYINQVHNILAQHLTEEERHSLTQGFSQLEAEAEHGGENRAKIKEAAKRTGAAVSSGVRRAGHAIASAVRRPNWLRKKPNGEAELNPDDDNVKAASGLLCTMITKMRKAQQRGHIAFEDMSNYAKQALDNHPRMKNALEKAQKGVALAWKYGIPMWQTVLATKGVISAPFDPFAIKTLIEQLQADFELTKEALGEKRVNAMNDKATGIMTAMKEKMGIPDGDTDNCT